jgi:hypothetical protein
MHFDPRYTVRCVQYLARIDRDTLRGAFDVALVSSAMRDRFPDPARTTYGALTPAMLLRRWTPDRRRGTKGPVVEAYRLEQLRR